MATRRIILGLDALAFISLALGLLGAAFFWLPAFGIGLSVGGLVLGLAGWVAAERSRATAAFYLGVGILVSAASLALNLLLTTGYLERFW